MVSFKGDKNPNYKTGYCIGKKRPSFYNSWVSMKQRCYNPKHHKYSRYGGRGIVVCDEWLTIEGFSSWAFENGWKQGLTIDRIDNNGNYCPENCRWVSVSENSRRKRTTKLTKKDAEEIRRKYKLGYTRKQLAEEFNCTEGNIWFIVHNVTHVAENECIKMIKQMKNC